MPAPTFVAAYNTDWQSYGPSPFYEKTLSVSTQAGDVLVVYAGVESSSLLIDTPTGNGVTFTLQEFHDGSDNHCATYIWTGIDATGGTNWTIECVGDSEFFYWGFGVAVFRNSTGIGATDQITDIEGTAQTLDLTTTSDNSAVLLVQTDWVPVNGASRTWATVNSITPSSGNGMELHYTYQALKYTGYAGYYSDVGSAGTKAVGVTSPANQRYTIAAVEIEGSAGPPANTAYVSWLTA